MKVYAGHICGKKKQANEFVAAGNVRGSYPMYVCDREVGPRGGHHRGKCYDSVHKVHF